MYKCLCKFKFSFCRVNTQETTKLFPRMVAPFYIPTSNVWVIQLLCPPVNACYFQHFVILAILVGV